GGLERAEGGHAQLEVAAVDVLHGHVPHALGPLDVVQAHDVGVVEGGDEARLLEAAHILARAAVKHLEGDEAAEHHVAREEHVRLAAGPEPPLDDVVADADDARRRAAGRGALTIGVGITASRHRLCGSRSASWTNSRRLAGSCSRPASMPMKSSYWPNPSVAAVAPSLCSSSLRMSLAKGPMWRASALSSPSMTIGPTESGARWVMPESTLSR